MTPERWQKVKEIFQSAIKRAPQERSAFLATACDGDNELRREVDSLISAHDKSGEFIDGRAFEVAAPWLSDPKSGLPPGQKVGPYEIISFISRGGMGEVYLAEDRRLNRRVALKLLPISYTRDNERLRRFEQEARAASALNHPNIITIFEILKTQTTHAIATEFVEGETLRQRLSRSTLTLGESLHIAIQVADALAAAHKAGIIHRDIKPENIMLRPDGYVKVLDFGLAKLSEQSLSAEDAVTLQVRTGSGVVMGTAGYMSPEQARGKEVDTRSDVFSLGAVIYEMVTQRKPFDGETPSDVLAAILKTDPLPISQFAPDAPHELTRIVTKALHKDREERYQGVRDLLLDLKSMARDLEFHERLKQTSALDSVAVETGGRSISHSTQLTDGISGTTPTVISRAPVSSIMRARRWPTFVLMGIIVIAAVTGLYVWLNRSKVSAPPVVANTMRITAWSGLDAQPTLAPDGNSVAYSSDQNGSFELYVRPLTPGGREIQLTKDGQQNFQPAWSPDGKFITYYSKNRGGIWIVPALGGEPRQLADFGSAPAWSPDSGTIAFQSDSNPDLGAGSVGSSTIWTVAITGGAPRQLTKVGNPAGGHINPAWSADGKRVAFVTLTFNSQDQHIWNVAVDGTGLERIAKSTGRVTYPAYAPDGSGLYYVTGPAIWMVPLSPKGQVSGEPLKVADEGSANVTRLAFSANAKRLTFSLQTLTSNICSVPVSAKSGESPGTPQFLTNQSGVRNNLLNFSPDGNKIAFSQLLRGGAQTISVMDHDGKNPVQITTEKSFLPSWFPDGDQIAFISNENRRTIWATSVQSKRARPLFDIGKNIEYARLSPDGRQVAFNLSDNGITNVWLAPLSGGQPRQLTFDKELAGFPAWSPDGRFIAYQVKRGDDAYVMLISTDGGESVALVSDHGRSWPYSFSPDGDKVAFAGERGGVWNVYWASRTTKQAKAVSNYAKLNAYVRYPAWSPLGNQIAYEYAETTGNIWVMDLK